VQKIISYTNNLKGFTDINTRVASRAGLYRHDKLDKNFNWIRNHNAELSN